MSDEPKVEKQKRVPFTNIIPAELRGKIIGSTGVMKKEKSDITNDKFCKENREFINACAKASEVIGKEVKPTRRQASKYRNKKGIAYLKGRF